ncbi:MAG: indolepyruvate ferredoxin oxidoreductase subunit alpha [Thermoplasmata archaeon]
MSERDVVSRGPGRAFMMANEAMVRGALEADVKLYAGYPGSPTSEILDTFASVAKEMDMVAEISANEKVALETAAGAAMAGLRSMTSMKSVGMNVASDSFFSLSYTGVKGGMVIVMADDPHAHSSQSEQDGRFFAPAAYVPMLEPSDPQEAKEMVREAFALSEKFAVPFLIRTVTRVNHQSGIVELGELKRTPFKKVSWPHGPARFVTVADRARAFKQNMLRRTEDVRREFEASGLNSVWVGLGRGETGVDVGVQEVGEARGTGVLASSAGFNYAAEACRILGLSIPILKLGTTFPLPSGLLSSFIRPLKRLVVVEELAPFLENSVRALAKDANPSLEIIGKASGHFSEALELNPNIVASVLARVLGLKTPVDYEAVLARAERLKEGLPSRPPTFCPGCPHRGTIYALRKALKGVKHVQPTDIGCYSMAPLAPLNYGDTLLSMGASLGVAEGLQHSVEEPVVAMIGDSTFLHAGLPGLVNAVHQRANFKLVILDNSVTAMTGQQHNPASPHEEGEEGEQRVDLEALVRGIGVRDVTVIDPYDIKNTPGKIKEALARPGLGVIISRRECALYGDRNKRRRGAAITPNEVNGQVCKKIYACVRDFNCPAISLNGEGRASISRELCDGCTMCARLCPIGAIRPVGSGGDTRGGPGGGAGREKQVEGGAREERTEVPEPRGGGG